MDTNEKTGRILDEALKVFAKFGYKKTSMDDIAGGMGMTKGNLYFYFKNKQDLYEKAVTYALLRWQTKVQETLRREGDVVKRFVALAIKSYEYLAEDGDLRAIIMKDPAIQAITPSEERFPTIGRAAYALVRDTIKQAVDEGRFREVDLEHVAGFLYSVYCMFIIKTYVKAEGHSAGEMYRAGIDVMLKGLLSDNERGQ